MKKLIIVLIVAAALIGILMTVYSQIKINEYDETIARADEILEEAEK